MKRLITSALLIATALSLVACSNNKRASSQVEKKDKTSLVSKKKKTNAKKKNTSKNKKVSNKTKTRKALADTSNNNQNNTQQTDNSQQAQSSSSQSQQDSNTNANSQQNQQQQQTQNDTSSQQQQSSGISYDENTLTGFVNKYGESPAAYKVDHGMSPLQALQSTPDSMKTFGEMQTQTGMENGSLNPDGSPSNQYGY